MTIDPLLTGPLEDIVERSSSLLVVGAGGGFDVLSAVPFGLAAAAVGRRVIFANVTFTDLEAVCPGCDGVHDAARDVDHPYAAVYYPEAQLAAAFARRELDLPVFALARTGVQTLRARLSKMVGWFDVDTVVLVDGGTDLLMRGDERGLGTPLEDQTSLAAAAKIDRVALEVLCAGFGIDRYHGVTDADSWATVDACVPDGRDAATVLWPQDSPACRTWRTIVDEVDPGQFARSYVTAAIAASYDGSVGGVPLPDGQPGVLPTGPLMAGYVHVDGRRLADRNLLAGRLEPTVTFDDVRRVLLGRR